MKKSLFILVAIMSLGVLLSGCSLFKKKDPQPTTTSKGSLINEPVNLIAVSERPFVSLVPRNDGKELTLAVQKLSKPATEAEFELEYTAGTTIQGAFGSMDLSSSASEYKVLLGSCSTGGTCSYHQDVQGGDIIVSLKGSEKYAVKFPWRFQDIAKSGNKFGSRDQKFQFSGSNLFKGSNFVVVSETSGLPGPLDKELLAGPYGVFPSNGLNPSDTANITIHLSNEATNAEILGWDGKQWVSLETQVSTKTASATGPTYQVYVVIR